MTTALITHPACLGHDPGEWHPECPDRLRAVLGALEAEEFAPLLRETAPEATREQLALAHPAEYVEAILSIRPPEGERVQLDGDTAMSAGSAEAALRAAGAAVAAVDAVMEGWARAAFAAVRPPGHHAEPRRRWGSACSTMLPWPPYGRAPRMGCGGSRWSISTFTTATARRPCSPMTPTCSTAPRTRALAIQEPGGGRRQGAQTMW